MSKLILESKAKRTASEMCGDILRAIKAGARTKASIRKLCNLSGSAVNRFLHLLERQGEIIQEGVEYFATNITQVLAKHRERIAPKLAHLRRTPNQKAADKTKTKSSAQLGRRRKNLVPCGCLLEQKGVPHVRCYYDYNDGWLVESAHFRHFARICEPIKAEIAEIDKQIDAKYGEAKARKEGLRAQVYAQIDALKAQNASLNRQNCAVLQAYERAAAEYYLLEQSLNGIAPKDEALEAQILAAWF